LIVTFVRGGSVTVKELLRRVTAWSVGARWYAFAILYFPSSKSPSPWRTVSRMARGHAAQIAPTMTLAAAGPMRARHA
jgi:hypothetical protein